MEMLHARGAQTHDEQDQQGCSNGKQPFIERHFSRFRVLDTATSVRRICVQSNRVVVLSNTCLPLVRFPL